MQPQQPLDSQPDPQDSPANQAGEVFNPNTNPPATNDASTAPASSEPSGTSMAPVSSSSQQQTDQKPPRRFKPSKKLAIVLAVVLVLLGASAAAYFGYYVPNRPQNVWRTALSRTAQGYDKVSNAVTSTKYDKGLKYDGSFKFDTTAFKADGSLKGASDAKDNSSTSGSVSASGLKLNFNLLTVASSASAPDLYFKVDGLQGLGSLLGVGDDPSFSKTLDGVNNHWYFVDHTLFEQGQSSSKNQTSITKKDVSDFLNAIGGPTKKYIFTSDEQNMAVVERQYVGKEKQDGLNTYHYKAGVNKANLKKWNTEVCDNLKDNKLYKMLSFGQDQATIDKECYDTSGIDKLSDSKTADAWVDLRTKLIHKVRFTDSKHPSNYVDVSQNYQGGNKIPLTLSFVDNSDGSNSKGLINVDYDTDSGNLSIKGNFSASGSDGGTASVNMTVAPSTAPVKVEKPAGAKNILQLMNDLGLSSLLGGSASGSNDLSPTLQ